MQIQITVRIDGREVANVEQVVAGTAAEIEEQTRRVQQRVGRAVLEVGWQARVDQGWRPCCCGRRMENRGRRTITVMTLSGEVSVERTRYRCRVCRRWLTPADGELCCGRHRVSRALAQRICQLATVQHFTRLEQLLADQHGVSVGHEEMLELVHDVGGTADRVRRAEAEVWHHTPPDRRTWPAPEVTPERVYVSCDGIMYCTNLCEPDPQHPEHDRLIWQQMRVGCVYWQDAQECWHKQVLWGRESAAEFSTSLYLLACRCGYRQAREKIFAADGADWCWEIRAGHFGDAVGIVDWYHVSEHVWAAAHALHPTEQDAASRWAGDALQILRTQGGTGLVDWLSDQRSSRRGGKRAALTALLKYLHRRLDRLDYPAYRSAGWQIGTGMIESTAKQLVGLRLKGPGMHWSEAGALAVTALLAQDLNQHWHTFWQSLVLAT